MSGKNDDFAFEPVPGLPARPPRGEELLWQGRPSVWGLAREAFKLNWIAAYFVGLAVWRTIALSDGSVLSVVAIATPYLMIGLVTCLILLGVAAVMARTTVYTITTARLAMRVGAALTVTLNLPYSQIASAALVLRRNGTGTIAVETMGDTRISYLVCWPHVRPWRFAHTQPALRAIPDAAQVAQLLAEAAQTRLNQPVVVRAGDAAVAMTPAE